MMERNRRRKGGLSDLTFNQLLLVVAGLILGLLLLVMGVTVLLPEFTPLAERLGFQGGGQYSGCSVDHHPAIEEGDDQGVPRLELNACFKVKPNFGNRDEIEITLSVLNELPETKDLRMTVFANDTDSGTNWVEQKSWEKNLRSQDEWLEGVDTEGFLEREDLRLFEKGIKVELEDRETGEIIASAVFVDGEIRDEPGTVNPLG